MLEKERHNLILKLVEERSIVSVGDLLDLLGAGLVRALGTLPHRAVLRAGRAVGRTGGRVLVHKHRRMCGNLRRAGSAQPARDARRAWEEGGANLFEILWLMGRGPGDPQVRLRIEGRDALASAAAERREGGSVHRKDGDPHHRSTA